MCVCGEGNDGVSMVRFSPLSRDQSHVRASAQICHLTRLPSLPPLPPHTQVALWDLRNMTSKLHLFERHDEEVFQVGGGGRGVGAAPARPAAGG